MNVAVAGLIALLALALIWFSRRLRRASGLPEGDVIYTDTGGWTRNEEVLRSDRHGLVGKPDYLVRSGGRLVPVEVKPMPAPARPRHGHRLQLGAYCLLVEARFGERPKHGLIRYADRTLSIPFDAELEQGVLDALAEMRRAAALPGGAPRDHDDVRRCAACGVRADCDQRLA